MSLNMLGIQKSAMVFRKKFYLPEEVGTGYGLEVKEIHINSHATLQPRFDYYFFY